MVVTFGILEWIFSRVFSFCIKRKLLISLLAVCDSTEKNAPSFLFYLLLLSKHDKTNNIIFLDLQGMLFLKVSHWLIAICQPAYRVRKHRNETMIKFGSNNSSFVKKDIWKLNLFKFGTCLVNICCQLFPSSKTSINGVLSCSVKLNSWRLGIQWRIRSSEWISHSVNNCRSNIFNDGIVGKSSSFIDRKFGILKKKKKYILL